MKKKLIEVALPLEAINAASAREKSIRHGHPSTLHLWWARRPLAAARAVIFSQMVDDPSSHPELFPTMEDQERERKRLFELIEKLVLWESTTNEEVLGQAREEIWKSWRLTCAENKDHPQAAELFNPEKLPAFHDPFAGGGALPLEAQRLGLEAWASDLNPVAVTINKAMIEIPPKFAGRKPVGPKAPGDDANDDLKDWSGAKGLAKDVRRYGAWMRAEAEKRIGHLYPPVEITEDMATARPDLKPLVGQKLTVIAWLWARTVKSPNPAFRDVEVPLAASFVLSSKKRKEAWVEPVIEGRGYRFSVKTGGPIPAEAKDGTKLGRGSFKCVMSGDPISGDYIKQEGQAGRLASRLMAIVAEGVRGRLYLTPVLIHETVIKAAAPTWRPEGFVPPRLTGGTCVPYGLKEWADLFTNRQLVALNTFSDLVKEAMAKCQHDALAAGMCDDEIGLEAGGLGAKAYAEAVGVYLALCVSRQTNRSASLNFWDTKGENIQQVFARQALPMVWDFVEGNPISNSTGNFIGQCSYLAKSIEISSPAKPDGYVSQNDAQSQAMSNGKIISTDPPYYDNIGYADLSDFFYVWLRKLLHTIIPNLYATLATPKEEELVATPYRHGNKEKAELFFLTGMREAIHNFARQAHPGFPVTIYYGFKQSETHKTEGTVSTGWETFLDAVLQSGFSITGTWPMHTEYTGNLKNTVNALASSIVLVCRKRPDSASTATPREFRLALKNELPEILYNLQQGNIAPVDLAQAVIGPGMAVFTRYDKVLEDDGGNMTVRQALAVIHKVKDEVLFGQDIDFEPDSRWASAWFESYGFETKEYGEAEKLSTGINTSVPGLVEAGILWAKAGKVRLLTPQELPTDWDPRTDKRLTVWEMTHHLIRRYQAEGEAGAADLAAQLGAEAETARLLAYRLYTICERKKWADHALSYNALVQSWPAIMKLARDLQVPAQPAETKLDLQGEK